MHLMLKCTCLSQEWINDLITFCLMSDAEYEKVTNGGDESKKFIQIGCWLGQYAVNRKQLIPFFCNRLDRFSQQPQ
jgi:hypothetical protein